MLWSDERIKKALSVLLDWPRNFLSSTVMQKEFALLAEMRDEYEARIAELQVALKNATDTIEHSAQRIASYVSEIEAKDAYIDDLEARIVELENEAKGTNE